MVSGGWDNEPSECSDHADPQEDNTSDRTSVLAVFQRAAAVLDEEPSGSARICTCNEGGFAGNDVGVCEGSRKSEHAGEDGADAPCELDGLGLAAFRPEEIEEEGRAEDGGDVDANEDVVGCDANEVIVMNSGTGRPFRNEVLLVDVVYGVLEGVLVRT